MKVDKFLYKKEEVALPSFIFPNYEKLNSSLHTEILNSIEVSSETIKGEALSSYMMKALQEIITRLEVLENA